jgi:hypothetical protein
MPVAWGPPAMGSLGVGCGFSDSGEMPLGTIGVEENGRALVRERMRGACCRAVCRERARGAVVRDWRCVSDRAVARASLETEVRDMVRAGVGIGDGDRWIEKLDISCLLSYCDIAWRNTRNHCRHDCTFALELPHSSKCGAGPATPAYAVA